MAYTRRGRQIRVSGGPGGLPTGYISTGSSWITNTTQLLNSYPNAIVQIVGGDVPNQSSLWIEQEVIQTDFAPGLVSGYVTYWREQSITQGRAELWAFDFQIQDTNASWSVTLEANRVPPYWTIVSQSNVLLGNHYARSSNPVNLANTWTQAEIDYPENVLLYPIYNDSDSYVVDGYFDIEGFSVDVNVPIWFPDADLQPPTTWFGQVNTTATTQMVAYGQQATFVNTTASSTATFTSTVIKETGSQVLATTTQTAQAKNIISAQASTASTSLATFDAFNIKGGQLIESADFDANFSAGILRGTATLALQSVTTSTAAGGLILDIGYNYAAGWVDPYPPYAEPALVQSYTATSQLFCAPTLEFIVDANIQAESMIGVEGGYLRVTGNLLMNGDANLDFGQFQANSQAGVIMRPVIPAFDADFEIGLTTGLIPFFGMIINAETEFYSIAGNAISGLVPLVTDTTLANTTDLFKGPQLPVFEVNATTSAVGGFRQAASAFLTDDFYTIRWSGKIISLDEYYVDRVDPELRILSIPYQPRTLIIDSDLRRWVLFPEDRIANTPREIRNIKPELGPPQQVARRIRRITA